MFMSLNVFAVKSLSKDIRIPVRKYQLENGLRVILNPNPQAKLVNFYFGIPTGSRHEKPGITGISHMFEHFMFKGTKKYPAFWKIYAENGVVGVNASTSFDRTDYISQFPPDKLELVLDVESDRLVNLEFSQKKLDTEREVVEEERRMRVDNRPDGMFFELTLRTVFKESPYRWPIIGYMRDIESYRLKDLQSWYRTYYSPGNGVLVLSGNFNVRKAKKLIEKYYLPLARQTLPEEKVVREPEQVRMRTEVIQQPVQLVKVRWVYRVPEAGTKDNISLQILSATLASGESGRLYQTLVKEKKVLNSISGFVWPLAKEGMFMIEYSLPDVSKESLVRSLVQAEIDKVIQEGLTERELEKVKNMELNQKVNGLKKGSQRVRWLAYYELLFQDYRKFYTELEVFNEISSYSVQMVARKFLRPERLSYLRMEPES